MTLDRSRVEVMLTVDQSLLVSGGTQGVRGLIASLVPTVRKHVVQKAKLSSANGSVPFILVYVHLQGTGAGDVRSNHILREVFAEVGNAQADSDVDSLWLGGVILDHRRADSPSVICCLRKRAAWPQGLTPSQLAKCVDGMLVDIDT